MPAHIHDDAAAEPSPRANGVDDLGLLGLTDGCIVVLPSITFPSTELWKITGLVRYEE